MSTTFTPSAAINMAKEKEWSSGLGMLDWDDVDIVFTKRSLIEFLKYTGITVDTSFANIHKLPQYAKIGSFSPPLSAEPASATTAAVTSPVVDDDSDAFKPTRRVRTAPGGPHTDIFGQDFQGEEDALSRAPPKHGVKAADTTAVDEPKVEQDEEEEEMGIQFSSNVKPSRRVRTEPGGKSSVGSLWDTDVPPEEFKPTRRVREGPGGQDNLNNLW
ncbi:hypothetical protein BDZ89DRAFT_977618 [Hymenopellis radicata]|nr:hypothetical protein BDZ89DRAFT_977618 [Hymenopellis radicata]